MTGRVVLLGNVSHYALIGISVCVMFCARKKDNARKDNDGNNRRGEWEIGEKRRVAEWRGKKASDE